MRLRVQRTATRESALDLAALVPEAVRRWVDDDASVRYRRVEGTVLVASAPRSPVPLLGEAMDVARRRGGHILKFTGGRIVVLFDRRAGHRDAEAAGAELRSRFGTASGVADGVVQLFLVGCSHRELFVSGTTIAHALAESSSAGGGRRAPGPGAAVVPMAWRGDLAPAAFVPEVIRRRTTEAIESNDVPVAVIHLANLDDLADEAGAETATRHLHDLVTRVQHSFAEHDVAFLSSDVAAGGPTILCAAGVARTANDDDDRLLRALRDITDYPSPIELRASMAYGRTTTGLIRSADTLTFVTIGDAVARADDLVMRADPSEILVTPDVIARTLTDYQHVMRIGTDLVYRIRKPVRHHRGTVNMLLNLGTLAFEHEDFAGAKQYFEQAVSVSRQLDFQSDEALALTHLARVALAMGDAELAMVRCDESLVLRRDLNDDLGIAEVLTLLGRARHADGDSATARRCWLRAIEILGRVRSSAEQSSV